MHIDGNFTELVNIQSPRQNVRLVRHAQRGLMLLLDDARQFEEYEEYRYHECLGVGPMLFCQPRSVFIAGGGDGLLATRLLKFHEITSITICDYDHVVTDLSRTQHDLKLLNENSLSSPKVTVINEDAMLYLENTNDIFDLIICDLPDPLTEELSRLYSQSFYEIVDRRLSEQGLLCVQTPGPEACCTIIQNTIKSIFPHTLFYRAYYRVGWSGFTLGSKNPLMRIRRVPKWTRYLNDAVVDSLFAIPKDECYRTDEVNTVENARLARIMLLGELHGRLSSPYRYHSDYRVIEVNADMKWPPDLVHTFIRYCDEIQPLIIHIDHEMTGKFTHLFHELGYRYQKNYEWMHYVFTPFNRRYIDNFLEKCDNGRIMKVDAYFCRTDENPELTGLLAEYFDLYADTYFDIPENYSIMEQRKLHLVARNKSGKAVVVATCFLDDEIYMDIIYGRGSSRENMLGLAYFIIYLEQEYKEGFYGDFVDHNLTRLFKKIGGQSVRSVDIFSKEH